MPSMLTGVVTRDNPRFRQVSGNIFTRPFMYIALRWSTALGFSMLLIVVGTLRVPSLLKKGDKIITYPC